jgi:uncharacterized membrane protein
MDINLVSVLAICAIYGIYRLIEYRRLKNKEETVRARVAWMLWAAAQQVRT